MEETKICKTCNKEKSVTEFLISKSSFGGRMQRCKECMYGHLPHKKPTIEKTCKKCNILKPIDEFGFVNKLQNHRYHMCKPCEQEYKEELKVKSGYNIKKGLKDRYNLSFKEYYQKKLEQDNKCAICGKITEKRLCADHNHTTHALRGLLCCSCNSILGFAYENISILESAISYLKKYNS